MHGVWLASYVALWVLVLGLVVGLVAVGRYVASVLESVAKRPMKSQERPGGPDVGTKLWDADTAPIDLGNASSAKSYLVLFISPECSACRALVPDLHKVVEHAGANLIALTEVAVSATDPYYEHFDRLKVPYVEAAHLFEKSHIMAVPTATLVSRDGVVLAKEVGPSADSLIRLLSQQKSA